MPGSDHFQVPIDTLKSIDHTLNGLKAELDGLVGSASILNGADDIHGHKVRSALAAYFGEWEDPRRKLIDNVGKLGTVSGKIAEVTEQYDDQVASKFSQFAAQLKSKK